MVDPHYPTLTDFGLTQTGKEAGWICFLTWRWTGNCKRKDQNTVSGVSSAASIWNTGAIGLAVAFDRFEIAILLAILNFITLFFFGKVKETVDQREASNE